MWDRAREISKQENGAVDIRKEKGRDKKKEKEREEREKARDIFEELRENQSGWSMRLMKSHCSPRKSYNSC